MNPPYVRQESIDAYYKQLYIENHPAVGSGITDLYVYFFDSALNIVDADGIIIFITLNKYLKTKYGAGLRNKLRFKNVDLIIDFFELPVFEASTDTAITKIINNNSDKTRYYPVKSLNNLDLNIIAKGEYLNVIKDESEWKFVDSNDINMMSKIYSNSKPLREFTDDKLFYGIKTGLNDAFILDSMKGIELLKSESKAIIKKYASSRSINKWEITDEKYFIATGYEQDISKKYSSAYNHLKTYKNELIKYYGEFENPKIIYIHTAKKHNFYLDTDGYYINNSCYMIISDSKFLFFFLNSLIFDWFKRIKFVAYGDAGEGGRVKLDYNKMITVPIKKISAEQSEWFDNKYIAIKNCLKEPERADIYEKEVESRLFKLYDLSYNEVKIIEPDFWLTEEEYFNIVI
ncbi:MAG: hypothetical protein NTV87_15545 [Ignavibacteriae bacterium]|nr:hypothetical protein [Ignavibacteriota bacterium]